jgi:hypothetical protein
MVGLLILLAMVGYMNAADVHANVTCNAQLVGVACSAK